MHSNHKSGMSIHSDIAAVEFVNFGDVQALAGIELPSRDEPSP